MNSTERMALIGTVGLRLEEKGEIKKMSEYLEHLTAKMQILERNLKIVTKGTGLFLNNDFRERGIGFSASLSKHSFLKAGEVIVFNEILSNQGKAFDPHSGIFTAPTAGQYIFSLTVRAQFHHQVSAELVHENKDEAKVLGQVTSGYGGIDRATACVTVVTKMAANSRVYARQIHEKIGEYHGNGCTTFTGVLLD